MIVCPVCENALQVKFIRSHFQCNYCNAKLESNVVYATCIPLLFSSIFVTPVIFYIFRSSLLALIVDLIIVLLILNITFPKLLNLKVKENNELD